MHSRRRYRVQIIEPIGKRGAPVFGHVLPNLKRTVHIVAYVLPLSTAWRVIAPACARRCPAKSCSRLVLAPRKTTFPLPPLWQVPCSARESWRDCCLPAARSGFHWRARNMIGAKSVAQSIALAGDFGIVAVSSEGELVRLAGLEPAFTVFSLSHIVAFSLFILQVMLRRYFVIASTFLHLRLMRGRKTCVALCRPLRCVVIVSQSNPAVFCVGLCPS